MCVFLLSVLIVCNLYVIFIVFQCFWQCACRPAAGARCLNSFRLCPYSEYYYYLIFASHYFSFAYVCQKLLDLVKAFERYR